MSEQPATESYWVGLAKDWGMAIAVVLGIMMVYALVLSPSPVSRGPAPPFTAQTTLGQTVSIPEQAGHVAVLNFWFTSCPPCRSEIPELSRFHDAHPDVPMYGVSTDTMPADRLEKVSRRLGITYDVLIDSSGAISQQYGVTLFPTTVVLHEGEVVFVRQGTIDEQGLTDAVAPFLHH